MLCIGISTGLTVMDEQRMALEKRINDLEKKQASEGPEVRKDEKRRKTSLSSFARRTNSPLSPLARVRACGECGWRLDARGASEGAAEESQLGRSRWGRRARWIRRAISSGTSGARPVSRIARIAHRTECLRVRIGFGGIGRAIFKIKFFV